MPKDKKSYEQKYRKVKNQMDKNTENQEFVYLMINYDYTIVTLMIINIYGMLN